MATFPGIYFPLIINDRTDISSWSNLSSSVSDPSFGQADQTHGTEKETFVDSGVRNPQVRKSVATQRIATGLFSFQSEFIYDSLYCEPSYVDLGTLVETTSYKFLVANLYPIPAQIVVNRFNYEGIVDDAGGSFTLGAYEDREVNVTITLTGGISFAASSIFTATNIPITQTGAIEYAKASSTYVGKRSTIWPFIPNEGWTETWEWETHITKMWNFNEERTPLRRRPRVVYSGTYSTSENGASYLDYLITGQGYLVFGVPRLEQATEILSPPAGSTVIHYDQPGMSFIAGASAILWKDEFHYEAFVIESLDENTLTLKKPLIKNLGGKCLLCPVVNGRMINTAQRTDYGKRSSDITVDWAVESPFTYNPSDTIGATFKDYQVFEVPIWAKNKQIERTYSSPKIVLDNGSGIIKYEHIQTYEDASQSIWIPCHSMNEILYMRGALLYMMGNVTPFWLSTGRNDLVLAEEYQPGSTLKVEFSYYSTYGKNKRKYLRIELIDGSIFYREVVDSHVSLEGFEEITIDRELKNEIIPISNFKQISFLSLVRMASDSAKWEWRRTNQKVDVTFSVTEVLA